MRKGILIGLVIAAMGTGLGLAQSGDRAFYVVPPGIPLPLAKSLAESACKGLMDRAVKLVDAGPKDVGCFSFYRRKSETLFNQLASGWALSLSATPVRLVAAYEVEGIFVASFVDTLNPSRGYYLAAGEVDPSTAQVVIWSISR